MLEAILSKARVDWIFLESPVGSDKLDQVTTDWMTNGLPIWSIVESGSASLSEAPYMAWYPYSSAKSVHDRLYCVGWASVNGADHGDGPWEVSFDTGATWVSAFSNPVTPPVDYEPGGIPTYAGTFDLDAEVTGVQWLGLRYNFPSVNTRYLRFVGFLYNSVDTPF